MIQDDELEASRRRLNNGLRIASGENPDTLAADRREATRLGVSVGALRLARSQGTPLPPPQVDIDELPRTSPRTTNFLSQPTNAAVAHDDIPNLSGLEGFLAGAGDLARDFAGGGGTALGTAIRGIGVAGMRTFDGGPLESTFEQVREVGMTVQRGGRNVGGALQEGDNVARPYAPKATDTGFAGQVAGALGQIVSQVMVAVATGGTGSAVSLAGQGVGAMDERVAESQVRENRVDEGYTLEDDLALIGGGAVTALSERLGLTAMMGKLPPVLRDRVRSKIGKIISGGAVEAASEIAETAGSNALAMLLLREDTEVLDGAPEAGAVGGTAGVIVSALVQSAIPGRQRAKAAEANATVLEQITTGAEASKLRERDPESFEQFVAEASEGGPVENLYIDGTVLNQAIQASGIDPDTLPPAIAEQLENAVATGGDVSIPVEQFAARIAGTDLAAPLIEHLRADPLAPSRAEVKAASTEELQAEVEQIINSTMTANELKASTDRVKAGLVANLNAAGRFTNDVNQVYAEIPSAFFEAMAVRMGTTPEALAEKFQSRVVAEYPGTARGEALDQTVEQVQLAHFSGAAGLTQSDPSRWGANSATPTGERARVGQAPGRTYFYDTSARQEPEGAISTTSPFRYAAKIPKASLYDFDNDPQNLREGLDPSAYEAAIQAAGFKGYFSNAVINGAVAVFDALSLQQVGAVRTQEDVAFVRRRVRELARADFLARVAAKTDPDEIVTTAPLANFQAQAEMEIPLAGAPKTAKVGGETIQVVPSVAARQAAANYMAQRGLQYSPPVVYAKVDTARAQRIAAAFDEMAHAPNDPIVHAAYRAMIDETLAQWQAIKATGLDVEFIDFAATGDPYAVSPRLAIKDVVENNHLWVFPTDDGFGSDDTDITGNPLLEWTDEYIGDRRLRANDVFRIVHDYFGHIKDGNGFRADGEENAWQSHAAMYTPLARRAMTSETRGQNSWVNYGPNGESNRTASAADTVYAPQKIGLLPLALSEEGFLGGTETFNQGPTEREQRLIDEIPGLKAVLPNLTQDEKAKLRRDTASKIVAMIDEFPSAEEMAAVAYSGRAKRGWYENSAQAILEIFGTQDAPRFAALLAALSPQTSVEGNLFNALATWTNWINEGRPTDRKELVELMGRSVQGKGTTESVLGSWINNSVTALTTEKPADITLSGPKVNSFMLNLIGVVDEVTNDAWMANYAFVPQTKFKKTGASPGKGPGYIAMNAVVRQAAEIVSEKTGQTWTPAEVQETVWSWAKTLYEKRDSAGENRTTQQLLAAGGLTAEEIAATPDFALLFTDGVYRRILEAGGYGQQIADLEAGGQAVFSDGDRGDPRSAEGTGFAETDFQAFLDTAAGRLEQLRTSRLEEAADKASSQGTLFQSDPAVGQPPFYSALARAVSENQTKRASAEQWKATLAKTPGVKKDEIEWSGVNDWLDGQVGAVDREALATYLQQGGVQLEEVVLGANSANLEARIVERAEELLDEQEQQYVESADFGGQLYVNEVEADEEGEGGGWAVFYEGRRIDNELYEDEDAAQDAADESNQNQQAEDLREFRRNRRPEAEREAETELLDGPDAAQFSSYKLPGADDSYREVLLTLPAIQGPSTHWDTENVVAHARITERADATGARVLFIEEVQSDWHQKGRDEGYATEQDPDRVAEALDAYQKAQDEQTKVAADFVEVLRAQLAEDITATEEARDAAVDGSEGFRDNLSNGVNELKNALGRIDSELASEDGNSVSAARLAANMLRRSRDGGLMLRRTRPLLFAGQAYEDANLTEREARVALDALTSGGIPDAPFRTSWSTLVMKRMIRYAVDNGFDKVAWINGNQQNGGQTGGDGSFFYERNLVNTTNDLLKKLGGRVEPVDMRDPERLARIEQERTPSLETRRELLADAVAEGDPAAIERAQERVDGYIADGERLLAGLSRPARNLGVQNGFTINDRMREVAAGGFPLFQENRGSITFGAGIGVSPATISLLRTADLTTYIHEMAGHFHLEAFMAMASDPDAPADVVADADLLLNWFRPGMTLAEWNGMTLDEKREYHEKYARGTEAYMMEGKAPSLALQPIFNRVRAWMLAVYKQLSALNVELTDEVRQVMGRMLASAEAIKEAEDANSFAPIYDSRPPFMDEAAWAEYQRSFAASTEEGMSELSSRTVGDMQWLSNAKNRKLKLLQREHKAARKQVRAEVEAEVRAEPINRARAYLRKGVDADGNPIEGAGKLDLGILRQMYGEETTALWRGLKTGGKFGEAGNGGLHPDAVAELFGFESGDALVRALISGEDMGQKISGLTDQRMLERYGDISDDQAMDRAANEAVANDARLRFVATEYTILAKAIGKPRAVAEAAKVYAAGIVNRIVMKRLKPAQFFAAQARAARAADKAAKAGDLVTAATQKRNQLINLQAARYAIKAQAEADKAMRLFTRIVTAKDDAIARSRDMNLVNAARAILAAHGLGRVKNAPIQYLEMLKTYDPEAYADLRPFLDSAMASPKTIDQMTFEEFQALRDTVAQLWMLSRRNKQIIIDGQARELETVRNELSDQLDALGEYPTSAPGVAEAASDKDKRNATLLSGRAALRRVESWVRAVDGGDNGPFRRYIWNPISDASNRYRASKTVFLQRYLKLFKAVEGGLTGAKIAANEIGYTFKNKGELLHALLHTGNLSNKSKLLLGRGWGKQTADGDLDSTVWDGMVARMIADGTLTKSDFDFAQSVWDLLEDMKPAAQAAHQQVYGRYFSEVTADEIVTPFGTYRGGYVPAMADPDMVADQARRSGQKAIEETPGGMFPAASNGFTKARVADYNKPLALDLGLLGGHIDKVLKFTHMAAPVRDAVRLLRGSKLADKLFAFDPTAETDLLLPWLGRAALQTIELPPKSKGGRAIAKFFRELRSRVGMQLMFANVSNTLQQFTGVFPLALRVGKRDIARAAVVYFKNPETVAKTIVEKSVFMANRTSTQMFEIMGEIDEMLLDPSKYDKLRDYATKHAYFLQSFVQNHMDFVGWTAAYDLALKRGDSEADAIRFADGVIRETQGTLNPEDVASIESQSAFVRSFLQFYNYFNVMANLTATEIMVVKRTTGLADGRGRLFYIYMMAIAAPALIASAIADGLRGGWDDDEDDGYLDEFLVWFFGAQAKYLVAFVPGVGQAANAAIGMATTKAQYDDRVSVSPSVSLFESFIKVPFEVGKTVFAGDEFDRSDIRDTMTLMGVLTKLPLGALGRPVGYVAGVAQGDIEPTGPVDFARGLVTGAPSPESKVD